MRYSAYSTYAEAKTDWIGHIPSHWEEWKVSHGFGQIGSGTTPKSDNSLYYGGDTLWVTTAELRESFVYETANNVTQEALDEHSALKKYPAGSVVIAMYGATIGRLGMLGEEATVNQACCVFSSPEKFDPRFFYFWLWMRRPILISLSSGGGQPNLNQEELKRLRVPIPSIEEQQQIATFLDWKTGQIDALIARKKELLEQLKEKRIAVITQAVTQGLDPAAPMRDSGIPWLGQVPQHWDVMKMSWVCKSIRDGTHNPPDRAPGIHRLLSVRNVQDGRFSLLSDDRTMTPEDFAELQRSYTVEENDIVLAIVGATTGKSAIVGRLENVTVQRSLAILRPDREAISSSFLHYVIQSPVVQTEIALTVFKYSAQPGIYLDDVGRLPVVRPPLPQQAAIAAYLDAETEKLDALVGKVEEVIDRLTEYRTALITAATTGKIDVRAVKILEPA